MRLSKKTQEAIITHAKECYPEESCGFIITEGTHRKYLPVENKSTIPDQHFLIPAETYAAIEDQHQIAALVHSHPDGFAALSHYDRHVSELFNLPSLVIAIGKQGDWAFSEFYTPEGWSPPLLGREWGHPYLNCYSLVRDYYDRELGISLPPPDIKVDYWWEKGENYYEDHYADAGFVNMGQAIIIEKHDVLLMQYKATVANHIAVFMPPGARLKSEDNVPPVAPSILHHKFGKLSCVDLYDAYWQKCLIKVLRHKDFIDAKT